MISLEHSVSLYGIMNLIIVNVLIVVCIISSIIYLIQTSLCWYIHNEAIECFCCCQKHPCKKVTSLGRLSPLGFGVSQSSLTNFTDWNGISNDKRLRKNTEMKLSGNSKFRGLSGWRLRNGETGGCGKNLNVFSLLL